MTKVTTHGETSISYDDYRDVEGIKLPYRVNEDEGDMVLPLTLQEIKINPDLPDGDFK